MSFEVGVNSYNSVAELQDFLTLRNHAATYTQAQLEGALAIASLDYVDGFFKFAGTPTTTMALPTNIVELTPSIKRAVNMAALLSLQGRLFVDPVSVQSQAVTGETKKVGSLEISRQYADRATYTSKYPTTAIDSILQQYVVGGGLGVARRCL